MLRSLKILPPFALVLVAGASFAACSDNDPRPGDTVWKPTTAAYDPDCETGCETLRSGEGPHGGEVRVSFNPAVDDPIAQWGDCLESFRSCVAVGGGAVACSQQSECPESCKQNFQGRASVLSDLGEQLDAFEAVYISENAPCLPPTSDEVGS